LSDINSKSSYGDKAEASECASSSDDEPVDEADIGYEHLTAQDWQKVQQFDCQCARLHPNVVTRVVAFDFEGSKEEQSLKRYVEEGRAAGVCLRLTEPWHNQGPRLLITDAWFGVPTSYALWQRGWFSITNVNTHTKHFCKKELWADARSDRRTHDRND
jgi:hypothetical protein